MAGTEPMGPKGTDAPHIPVLLDAVLQSFDPVNGKRIVDGTFGAGGYSRALLEAGAGVVAIDRDPSVAPHTASLAAHFPDRFTFLPGQFSELDHLAEGQTPVDGVVLDIGVSSMQLDQPERGFSFLRDGPLDMRMGNTGPTAADLVAGLDERDLADLIFGLGEERRSRPIAAAVIAERKSAPIETTGRLAAIIESVIRRKPGESHPATRTFQALRIAVNAELTELVEGLFASERLLGDGGTLSVVTFHSLEDRIVKRFFKPAETGSRHVPQVRREAPRWDPVAKPVRAGEAEITRNPRARSATLRSATRTAQPPRPADPAGLGVPGAALKGFAE